MKLPWRKRWLVGFDLSGNTFWEFKDTLNSNRFRRIVKYSRQTHFSDVNVTPQWTQWLRHTRFDPPSLAEQRADVVRQENIKVLAAAADARWASKPSMLDPPDKQQPAQMLTSRDPSTGVAQTGAVDTSNINVQERSPKIVGDASRGNTSANYMPESEPKDSPWKKATRGGPSEDWQPQSWTPSPTRKRA